MSSPSPSQILKDTSSARDNQDSVRFDILTPEYVRQYLPRALLKPRTNYKTIMLGSEIVTIYLDSKRKKITVHRKLLCDKSSFFDKDFNGPFPEVREGIMYLPEDNMNTVGLLVDFIYRGRFTKILEDWPGRVLSKLYYFAEKLCMGGLIDRIDEIKSDCVKRDAMISLDSLLELYQSTHEKSKLPWFFVAVIASYMAANKHDDPWCDKFTAFKSSCPEFFVDIFRFQAKHVKALSLTKGNCFERLAVNVGPCEFYSHEKAEDSYLKASQT